MRHGSGNRRQRGRHNGRKQNNAPNRSQVFDSNGPEVRIRGTAHQIVEKYAALAKDAASSGDHTLSENYKQHAEHYQRMICEWDEMDRIRNEKKQAEREKREAEEMAAEEENTAAPSKPEAEDLGLPQSMLVEAPVEEKAVTAESAEEEVA